MIQVNDTVAAYDGDTRYVGKVMSITGNLAILKVATYEDAFEFNVKQCRKLNVKTSPEWFVNVYANHLGKPFKTRAEALAKASPECLETIRLIKAKNQKTA